MDGASIPQARTTRQLLRLGYVAIVGVGLVFALLIAYGLVSEAPLVGLVPPLVLALGLAGVLARPSPNAVMTIVLGASAILLTGEAGVSVVEVIYGLVAMGFLALWVLHATLAGAGVVRSTTDLSVALWCTAGILGGVALGVLFGGDPYDFRADVQAALFLPFYFPIKEAVRRTKQGPLTLLILLISLGVFAAASNTLTLRAQLAEATAVYEIVDVRVPGGMMQVSAGILFTLATLAVPQKRSTQIVLLGALAILLVGLVTGKSRAYWVAVVLGIAIIGVLFRRADRRRLGLFLAVGVLGVVGMAIVIVGDQLFLIGAGAMDRLNSLSGAGRDVSLVNRFVETQAALERISQNPILGHGWGTQITYYSLVSSGTMHWGFMHNGYIAMWFKLGLWGLGLIAVAWFSSLFRGAWTAWAYPLPATERALLIGCVSSLAVFSITAITSNPFSIMDQVLFVAFLLGSINGVIQRNRLTS